MIPFEANPYKSKCIFLAISKLKRPAFLPIIFSSCNTRRLISLFEHKSAAFPSILFCCANFYNAYFEGVAMATAKLKVG